MKQNKKAILGFAVAMIFSLGIMQGISTKNHKQDMSLQQVGGGCAYMSGVTEGGAQATWAYAANASLAASSVMAGYGLSTAYVSTTTPVGWGYWIATGIVLL